MLGFAVVLAISAVSMGIAYLGFERVSAGVASYRNSVLEADLARNIDRELISYRALARYYVVTGKEDDGKAALAAETGLKDAIDRSMKGTTAPARLDQVRRLANEFAAFTKIFADILKVKSDSALVAQNQLTRGGTMLRYKLDDLASKAAEAATPRHRTRRQAGGGAISGRDGARQHLRHQFRPGGRHQRAGAPQVRRELAAGDFLDRRKDRAGPQGGFRHAGGISAVLQQAGRKFEIGR